jgi:hypothetical protein
VSANVYEVAGRPEWRIVRIKCRKKGCGQILTVPQSPEPAQCQCGTWYRWRDVGPPVRTVTLKGQDQSS